MRVAAVYDVHANLPALEAVLDEIQREGVDCIIVGGDVLPGPMPDGTLDCLLSLDVPVNFIRGNGDRVVQEFLGGGEIKEVPEQFHDTIHWTAHQLRLEHRAAIGSWPLTHRLKVDGIGDVLFCHATPRNDFELFTRETAVDRVRPIFERAADVVVCGHTHMQFDRMVGAVRVVNAGSVGMPFSRPAGAYWLLLDGDVEFRRTLYDTGRAAARIRSTGYPQVEELVIRYVVNPPTEAETLKLFAPAEVKQVEPEFNLALVPEDVPNDSAELFALADGYAAGWRPDGADGTDDED